MNEFKRGVEKILERRPVPVVPMALRGLWGSFFSRRDGKNAMSQLPRRFWSRIELVATAPVPGDAATAPDCSRSSPACAASGNRDPQADIFGTITRVGDTVVRDTRAARPWARWLARHLMRREHRALTRLALGRGIEGIPNASTSGTAA